MELLREIIKALPAAATSPLALFGYVLVVAAWTVVALKVQRNKNLLNNLKSLPPKDRLPALRDEMGAVSLKEGLSPEQYLRSRIYLYYFLAFVILCLTIATLFILARAQPKERGPEAARIYGKVFAAEDRRAGVPGATIFLEQEVTRSAVTTDTGEFLFEVPAANAGKQATVWATADKFGSSAPRTIIVEPLDKIFISLSPVEEPAPTPTSPVAAAAAQKKREDAGNSPVVVAQPKAAPSPPAFDCFGPRLTLTPVRAESRPGAPVSFSTDGVDGGRDFGGVSYRWTASAGRIEPSGLGARLDTAGLPNCTFIEVRVTAKNGDGSCVATGAAKLHLNDITRPCTR